MPSIARGLPLLLVLFPAACSTTTNDNRVTGPLGFEVLDPQTHFPVGWEQGAGGFAIYPAGAPWRPDSMVKRSGRHSLFLHAPTEADGSFIAHVVNKRLRASTITVTGYMRTEDVRGNAKLWLSLEGAGGQVVSMLRELSSAATGTTGWTAYSVTSRIDFGARVQCIRAGAWLMGSGKVWLDDVRITADGTDIAKVPEERIALLPADRDTTFLRGSGIASIPLTPQRVETLAKLGSLWSFVKYHHSAVQRGEHNMDAALFRVLPAVLREETVAGADAVIEQWVAGFGAPARCDSCKDATILADSVHILPDYGKLFDARAFPTSLVSKLRGILAGRLPGDGDHYYIGLVKAVGNPIFRHERPYRDTPYPDAGVRLLALYRYWAMIQYFFPNRHLIGEDWNAVLADSIPGFVGAADALAYQTACQKLIVRIHDTHAGLQGATALARATGTMTLPVSLKFGAGEELVVTGYHGDTVHDVLPGDIVRRIDGVPVAELVARHRPLISTSNPSTALRGLAAPYGFLARSDVPVAVFSILRDGKTREVRVRRVPFSAAHSARVEQKPAVATGWGVLPGGTGYLFPAKLSEDSSDEVMAALHGTRGLIIDFRCYPSASLNPYYTWLHARPATFTRITAGSTGLPGLFRRRDSVTTGARGEAAYRGKVVILVNEETQSAAEFATMAFQTVPGAVTIGSTTAGADGNVSRITLPGGLGTGISGIGILYPDGTETQRAGVRIDKVVKPTASGIRAGKDEVLEAALALLGAVRRE